MTEFGFIFISAAEQEGTNENRDRYQKWIRVWQPTFPRKFSYLPCLTDDSILTGESRRAKNSMPLDVPDSFRRYCGLKETADYEKLWATVRQRSFPFFGPLLFWSCPSNSIILISEVRQFQDFDYCILKFVPNYAHVKQRYQGTLQLQQCYIYFKAI